MLKIDNFMKYYELKKGELNPNTELLIDDCSNYDPALREYSIIFRKERKAEFIEELDSYFEKHMDSSLEVFVEMCKEAPGRLIVGAVQRTIGRYVYEKTGTAEKFLEFFGVGLKKEEEEVDGNEVMQILAKEEFDEQAEVNVEGSANQEVIETVSTESVQSSDLNVELAQSEQNILTGSYVDLDESLNITEQELGELEIPIGEEIKLDSDQVDQVLDSTEELDIPNLGASIGEELKVDSLDQSLPLNGSNVGMPDLSKIDPLAGGTALDEAGGKLEGSQDFNLGDWDLNAGLEGQQSDDPLFNATQLNFNEEVATGSETLHSEGLMTEADSVLNEHEIITEQSVNEAVDSAVGQVLDEAYMAVEDKTQELASTETDLAVKESVNTTVEEIINPSFTKGKDKSPEGIYNPYENIHEESKRTVSAMQATSKEVVEMMKQMHQEIQNTSVMLTGKMETNDFPILSNEDFHDFMSQMEKTPPEHIKRLFMFILKTYWRAGNVAFVSKICNEFIELDYEIGRRPY